MCESRWFRAAFWDLSSFPVMVYVAATLSIIIGGKLMCSSNLSRAEISILQETEPKAGKTFKLSKLRGLTKSRKMVGHFTPENTFGIAAKTWQSVDFWDITKINQKVRSVGTERGWRDKSN
jgi:hypothetical protein